MNRKRLSIPKWLLGSLLGLVFVNLGLIAVVAATDVGMGAPPQLAVPLFALAFSACAIAAVRRSSTRTPEALEDEAELQPVRGRRFATQVPGYLSMTVIRRAPVYVSTPTNEWKGAIQ